MEKEKRVSFPKRAIPQIWYLSDERIYGNVNRVRAEFLGAKKENVEGRDIYEFMDKERADACAAANRYVFKKKEVLGTEEWMINAAGEERLFSVVRIPYLNERKEVEHVLVCAVDITDHHRAKEEAEQRALEKEQKYKRERDYFESVLENSADAISLLDKKGRIFRWNARAAELSGYSFKEIRDRHFSEFYPDGEEPEELLADLRKDGVVRNREVALAGKDGSIIPCVVSCRLLYDDSGELNGSVNIIRDLSEWKKIRRQVRELTIYDPLTGLYNRNFFEKEMNRFNNGDSVPLGLLVCDLDNFKKVNDKMGHGTANEMLTNVARMLKNNFRAEDIISRTGGDEFAVLLPGAKLQTIRQKKKLLEKKAEDYGRQNGDNLFSLSIGYAAREDGTIDVRELFNEASTRMYQEKIQKEASGRSAAVKALTRTLEVRDLETEDHCDRLRELLSSFGRLLGLDENNVKELLLLARFHDLGKVGIPDQILFKPGSLTEEEWRQMKAHSEIGYNIAQADPHLAVIADYILKHHERWDGAGYPLGLKKRDIPAACRMLAITDAYDAMTSDRPYRKALTHKEALTEIENNSGTQFDPDMVEHFFRIIGKIRNK